MQDRGLRWRGPAGVFRLQPSQKLAFGTFNFGRAELAIGGQQVACAEPLQHGAFDVRIGPCGITAGMPHQRLFQKSNLASQVLEELREKSIAIIVSNMPKCHRQSAIHFVCEEGRLEIGRHEAAQVFGEFCLVLARFPFRCGEVGGGEPGAHERPGVEDDRHGGLRG